jgi:hypothetical protein
LSKYIFLLPLFNRCLLSMHLIFMQFQLLFNLIASKFYDIIINLFPCQAVEITDWLHLNFQKLNFPLQVYDRLTVISNCNTMLIEFLYILFKMIILLIYLPFKLIDSGIKSMIGNRLIAWSLILPCLHCLNFCIKSINSRGHSLGLNFE